MEDIYYLLHKTKHYNKEDWKELKTSSIDNSDDQFPGVYLTLITKDNIKSGKLYPGKYVLIFSRKLLNQKNYHINIQDNNGMITETNTYYPWNINEAVDKIKKSTENTTMNEVNTTTTEVVFHDPISMKYLCKVIELPTPKELADLSDEEYEKFLSNSYLPKKIIENDTEPDMSKEPFYCYPQTNYIEDNTAMDEKLSSPDNFLKTMANVCNINTNLKKKDLINEIKEKIPHLYSNRNEQNIQALKDFTNKDKKIGGRKRKRRTKKVKKRKIKRTVKRKQK